MSKIHDGKLNIDENYPIDEDVKDTEPVIDEEVEEALLTAMNLEVPDLWDRIESGIDSSEKVVPFEKKTGKSDERSSERRKKKRVWAKYLVAAALVMIVMIPVIRVLGDAQRSTSGESAKSDNAMVYESTTEASYEEAAAASETYYESTVAEAVEEDGIEYQFTDDERDIDVGKGKQNYTVNGSSAAADTTAESTEAATEAEEVEGVTTGGELAGEGSTTKNIMYGKYTLGTLEAVKMGNGEIEVLMIGYIYTEDDEYFIKDYQDVLSSQSTVFTDPVRITNPAESGLIDYLEGSGHGSEQRVLIGVKYPDKNNTKEVEIVEILEDE